MEVGIDESNAMLK